MSASTKRCLARTAAAVVTVLCSTLPFTGQALGAAADIPNPCIAVPGSMVAAALGLKTAPVSSVAVVGTMQTCSYAGVKLSVLVGSSAIGNPARPLRSSKVTGLPHATFTTYAGSTQTQLLFYEGTASTGVYGVIRNYGRIRPAPLETFARALDAAITGGGSQSAPAVHIIG